jgi:hypothetical protein
MLNYSCKYEGCDLSDSEVCLNKEVQNFNSVKEDLEDTSSVQQPLVSPMNSEQPIKLNEEDKELVQDFINLFIVLIIGYLITLILVLMAVSKTPNDIIKVMLLMGIFIPPLSPVSFVLSILILSGIKM